MPRTVSQDMGIFAGCRRLNGTVSTATLREWWPRSGLIGYGHVIDLAGCRAAAPGVLSDFRDMPYYDCFLKTVTKLSDFAAHFIPRDTVKFTFDQHKETQYNAGLLYEWITAHKPDNTGKVSFASRAEPGVQAADRWARELMKRCDTHLFNDRARARPSWAPSAFNFISLWGANWHRPWTKHHYWRD